MGGLQHRLHFKRAPTTRGTKNKFASESKTPTSLNESTRNKGNNNSCLEVQKIDFTKRRALYKINMPRGQQQRLHLMRAPIRREIKIKKKLKQKKKKQTIVLRRKSLTSKVLDTDEDTR